MQFQDSKERTRPISSLRVEDWSRTIHVCVYLQNNKIWQLTINYHTLQYCWNNSSILCSSFTRPPHNGVAPFHVWQDQRWSFNTLSRGSCPVSHVCMCTTLSDLDPNDILHTKDAGNRSQIATTFNPTVLGPLVIPLRWYAWFPYPSKVFDTKFRTKQRETCFHPRNSRFRAQKVRKNIKFWPVTRPILHLKINRWAFWKRGQAGDKLNRISKFLATAIFFFTPA